jgi:hypothetical protein
VLSPKAGKAVRVTKKGKARVKEPKEWRPKKTENGLQLLPAFGADKDLIPEI